MTPSSRGILFIGDSISGNYDAGLRESLEGQFNIHHPPTNCGPSNKGREFIYEWLGAYEEEGRGWDIISFNFGHWNAGDSKEMYQGDLEYIISVLKKTGAKLVFVTTCPVPEGYPAAGDVVMKNGATYAPGRQSGVMKKYINPWALEVIRKHPEITVCDQWQFVEDRRENLYQDWWAGENVHFSRDKAFALGQFLAEHIQSRF